MSRRTFCWVVAVGVCNLPASVFAEGFGDLQIIHGMDALERGDDAQALIHLAPIADGLSHDDVWLEARFLAAQAAGNLGLYEPALAYLERLEEMLPEVADFVVGQRARTLRAVSRFGEARQAWQLILDKYPDSPLRPEATYGVADALYGLEQTDKAFAAYDTAQRLFPRSDRAAVARFNMARTHEERHNVAAAAALYRSLITSGGLMAAPAGARLDALVQKKAAPPTVFSQRLALIDRLISSRTLDDAEAAIAASEGSVPDTAGRSALQARRAALAYRRQDFTKAVGLLKDLIAQASGKLKLDHQRLLATVHAAARQYREAVDIYRDIAAHYRGAKEGRDAQYRAAWLAYNGGDHASAVKLFQEFLAHYPTDRNADEALWYVAWNAYHLQDFPNVLAALSRLRTAYSRSPLHDRTWYWEGRVQARLGQVAAATQAYERAARHPTTYYGMLSLARLAELAQGLAQSPPASDRMVAALGPAGVTDDDPSPTTPAALPGGITALRSADMPWGAGVFAWDNAVGKRALRLIRLGLRREAARLVPTLPVLAGLSKAELTYGRARLLFALSEFAGAYRLVSQSFRDELDALPAGRAKRYFHIAYPDAHAEMVLSAAKEFDVSPLLVLAIMRQESAFDDQANSWASARGLMQIIPVTGRRIADVLQLDPYNDGVLREPVVNVRFGTWYLAQLVQKFEGNVVLAIGAYNAGPQAVQRWVDERAECATDEFVEDIPYRETRHYVKNVAANLAIYSRLYANQTFELPRTIAASYRDNVNF